MTTMIERFILWFAHECDSNSKIIAMLESVPAEKQGDPDFVKALEKASHIGLARKLWLARLGATQKAPTSLFTALPIPELKALYSEVQSEWNAYLSSLTDADLSKTFEYVRQGLKIQYIVEKALTQVNGHAWYHRGQIGMLVARLGGKFVDTDLVFWDKPEVLGEAKYPR